MEKELVELGEPRGKKSKKNNIIQFPQEDVEEFLSVVQDELDSCSTKKEVLEKELYKLSECSSIALEIYKKAPVPDNAYMVSSLVNSHKAALSQFEKMQDPKQLMSDTQNVIQKMFVRLIKAMADEINKTKQEFRTQYPNDAETVEDAFTRMLNAIQPNTQNLFDDLSSNLLTVFGIKEEKD